MEREREREREKVTVKRSADQSELDPAGLGATLTQSSCCPVVRQRGRAPDMTKFKKLPTSRHPLLLNTTLKQDHTSIKKKTFKICLKKLRSIQDAETKLCQAVLINNTLKCLNNDSKSGISDENKNTNDFDYIDEREAPREREDMMDIFTEISLPPPLNTNQLEKFAIINSDKESFYYHEVKNYHKEEEIRLYDQLYGCSTLLNSSNLYNNLQRTQ